MDVLAAGVATMVDVMWCCEGPQIRGVERDNWQVRSRRIPLHPQWEIWQVKEPSMRHMAGEEALSGRYGR